MHTDCAVYQAANILGKRWTLLVLLALHHGHARSKRYSELKQALPGITPKLLSQRLKELETEGLITKAVDARTVPIKCEYAFTENGRAFMRVVKGIKAWSRRWNSARGFCTKVACRECRL